MKSQNETQQTTKKHNLAHVLVPIQGENEWIIQESVDGGWRMGGYLPFVSQEM